MSDDTKAPVSVAPLDVDTLAYMKGMQDGLKDGRKHALGQAWNIADINGDVDTANEILALIKKDKTDE